MIQAAPRPASAPPTPTAYNIHLVRRPATTSLSVPSQFDLRKTSRTLPSKVLHLSTKANCKLGSVRRLNDLREENAHNPRRKQIIKLRLCMTRWHVHDEPLSSPRATAQLQQKSMVAASDKARADMANKLRNLPRSLSRSCSSFFVEMLTKLFEFSVSKVLCIYVKACPQPYATSAPKKSSAAFSKLHHHPA